MSKNKSSSETGRKAARRVSAAKRDGPSSKSVRHLARSSKRFAEAMKALAKR
jgi:hypothetical protein